MEPTLTTKPLQRERRRIFRAAVVEARIAAAGAEASATASAQLAQERRKSREGGRAGAKASERLAEMPTAAEAAAEAEVQEREACVADGFAEQHIHDWAATLGGGADAVAADVELVWRNCEEYNTLDSDLAVAS